jgi:tetratricopeptide (TPR) repeat protein
MLLIDSPTNATREAVACNDRALARYLAGDRQGALSGFQEAIRTCPDYPQAWNNAAIVLQQLGQLDDALAHFDGALARRPEYADALNNRGRLRHLRGDLAGAATDFDAALDVAGESLLAAVLHNRATLRQARNDLFGALADFARALEIAPEQVMTWRARGLARKAADDLQGALADLDRAVALTPPAAAATVLHERGGVKVLLNDWIGAIADYDQALALEPKFWLAYVSRGHARYHRRDFAGTADYLRAMRLDAEGTVREVARFVREDAARDAQSVLENCDKHVRINARDPIAHARRCLTLALLGRHADAAEEAAQFRALAPDLAGLLEGVLGSIRGM